MTGRPFAWERSYPPGLAWDAPLSVGTLPDLLRRAVESHRDRPALAFRDIRMTYGELGRRAEAFGRALAGIAADAVALLLPNSPWHPIAFFGATLAGARIVHLSPLDAARELAHKLRDSGARTLVTTNSGDLVARAAALLAERLVDRVIVADDAAWGSSPVPASPIPDVPGLLRLERFLAETEAAELPRVRPDDVALLQYTGGTTGTPKGAVLTHANLTAAVSQYAAWFGASATDRTGRDRIICVLPLFHIYALTTILLRGLARGAELLLRPRFDPEAILRDIEVERATHFPGVPTMWIALSAVPGIEERDFTSLVYCGSGGAPLPVEVADRFERLTGHRLVGGWGMTETSPAGTNRLAAGTSRPGTIGIPLPGVEMDVASLDDHGLSLPVGATGELRVRGPNVFGGYWNRPEETCAAFAPGGWFLTGDIGHMDPDGFFFLTDRKKDMIISGGFNVYPQAIENAVYQHPSVEECLVIGVPDPYRGEAAKAFCKLRAGAPHLTLADLQLFLADKVGRHEMPTALEIRPALPRTAVGKLSKLELRQEERDRQVAEQARPIKV